MVGSVLGVSSVLLLSAMLFPSLPDSVSAEEANTKVSLTVNPVIGIALDEAVTVEVLPTADGTFSSNKANLSVTTNNETGYSLYLATTNGENTLTSNNPSTTETINAITLADGTDSIPSSDFANNTWGYNLSTGDVSASDSTTYKPVPTTNGTTPINTPTEAPTEGNGDTYSLIFGTKINTALPSGTYSNDVVVSAVANPAYVPTLSAIDNMQEMTAEICQASTENETKQLTDTRDGKKYWVTKLADGNCWMTQNLDLDLTNGKALTPDDSDVSSNWNPPRSTEKNGTVTSNSTNTETYSWDFGLYVKNNPDDYDSYCNNVKTMSGCNGWTDATNLTPAETAETEWTGSVDNTVSGNTYDAHFLIGNFYQWNAATAGTGGTITSQDATDSICPKGWQLPTSNNSNSGSFGGLVGSLNSTTITQAPYYFNPSGRVYSGSLWYAGYGGYYWSSTAYSSTSSAYSLYFYSGGVNPSGNFGRYLGQSVRCLASQ